MTDPRAVLHRRDTKPLLLDAFCGAGGCGKGFEAAGFDVVGIDLHPQKNYPYDFIQGDALDLLKALLNGEAIGPSRDGHYYRLEDFGAFHASPPCQAFTAYQRTGNVGEYPDLIVPTRAALRATGLPWVMENVVGAPLEDPLLLCGSMFDMDIQRHRLFESNVPLEPPVWPCRHKLWGPDRFPGGRSKERTGSSRGLVRATIEIGSWDIPFDVQQRAMGIDWTTLPELSEAIPPVYTEFIGRRLMAHVYAEELADAA